MKQIIQVNPKFQSLCRIFSSLVILALCAVFSIEQKSVSADTSSSKSLVLLYADPENDSGLIYQGLHNGQNGQGNDNFAMLRADLIKYAEVNPDIVIRLLIDNTDGRRIYTLDSNSGEQVEEQRASQDTFDNISTFLSESIIALDGHKAFFAVVDYDNGWLQDIRPVTNRSRVPCIANPAHWQVEGRPPDTFEDGGRPLPGGSSQGRGHNELENALCRTYDATSQQIGVMSFNAILDFLADRAEVGTCSSLDSLLPHLSIRSQYINVSSTSGGRIAGIQFQNRDILRYDMTNNLWSMLFDASEVGINRGNLDAFHVMDDGAILFSLSAPLSLPGVGRVDDSDIVRFIPSRAEDPFELYFDGSDVKLTRASEDIDAISMLPDGKLLISTVGNVNVNGVRKGRDEDVLLFEPTSLGRRTRGTWSLYLDGSKVGLSTRNENIVGIDLDSSLPKRDVLHLATRGNFAAPMVRGANPDILSYAPDGSNQCTFEMSLRWDDFKSYFAGEKLDGISYQIDGSGGLMTASSVDRAASDHTGQPILSANESENYSLYLPIISRE